MRRGYRGLPHSLHEQASKRVGDSEEGKMEGGLGEVGGGGEGKLPSARIDDFSKSLR